MRELPQPLRKSEGQWHAEKHCRLKRVIPRSFPQSNLRQTSLDAREAKLSNHVRQVIYSKLRSIAARTSACILHTGLQDVVVQAQEANAALQELLELFLHLCRPL